MRWNDARVLMFFVRSFRRSFSLIHLCTVHFINIRPPLCRHCSYFPFPCVRCFVFFHWQHIIRAFVFIFRSIWEILLFNPLKKHSNGEIENVPTSLLTCIFMFANLLCKHSFRFECSEIIFGKQNISCF